MRSILIASPMITFAFTAATQTMPNVPKLPAEEKPAVTAPSATAAERHLDTRHGVDIKSHRQGEDRGGVQDPDQPTKPQCIELMLKK